MYKYITINSLFSGRQTDCFQDNKNLAHNISYFTPDVLKYATGILNIRITIIPIFGTKLVLPFSNKQKFNPIAFYNHSITNPIPNMNCR